MKDHDPEIVVLTETKVKKSGVEEIIENLPFNSFEVVDPVGLSGGILILWNSGVNSITTVTKDRRFITRLFRALQMELHLDMRFEPRESNAVVDILAKDARCHLQDLNQICILDHMPVICGEAFVRDLSNCTELSVSTDAGDVPAETSCNVTFN
ncbi:uncharacterized protein LOC110729525 [Chenopodium quinoa]|uniref:uncharacterized protein LOC110729525 n=1 Tax=Chenopodium quinoa TaxID=63459 RepID=UPI000B7937CC|nr:uncharacterized protein LOC110729525 [Chenopodium quinoa]